jgi:ABC-type multidrug transport system ATPase subunit
MLLIRDLVKVYPGSVTALQGVSLEVGPGMFGLLGPNGAGKSTLMKIVAGLLEPTSGAVELDGVDITREPQRVREQLGYLPQDFGFYSHLTGEAMLVHLLRLKGVESPRGTKALARELLERVNLASAAQRKVKGYSGGMRQRLGIAQALAGDPRLVIVDEPTAGLDPVERRRFQNLLSEVGEDVVVILSTHIVDDVSALCPRVAIMAGGRILRVGEPRALIAELDGRLWSTAVDKTEAERLRATLNVVSTRIVAGRTEVRALADSAPPGMQSAAATLEDVYFATLLEHGIDTTAE